MLDAADDSELGFKLQENCFLIVCQFNTELISRVFEDHLISVVHVVEEARVEVAVSHNGCETPVDNELGAIRHCCESAKVSRIDSPVFALPVAGLDKAGSDEVHLEIFHTVSPISCGFYGKPSACSKTILNKGEIEKGAYYVPH